MREIEAMLREGQKEWDKIPVPEELEKRLRGALDKKSKRRRPYVLAAAVAVFLLFFVYNFQAVAYYAKRLVGFDHVMSGTLRDLNELGRGQVIDKSCTLDNGIRLTLEGIMVDDNRLLAFITQENSAGGSSKWISHVKIKGLFKEYISNSGYGKYSGDESVIKYIFEFDPPGPLERNLTLHLPLQGDEEGVTREGTINFALDRNKAMGFILQEKIRRTISLEDGGRIDFDRITVSPTMTTVEGSLKLPAGRLPSEDSLHRRVGGDLDLDLQLFADGQEIGLLGYNLGGRTPGEYTFKMSYDTLPADTAVIKIALIALTDRQDLGRVVELVPGKQEIPLLLEGQALTITNLEILPERAILTALTGSKTPLIEAAGLSFGKVKVPLIDINKGYPTGEAKKNGGGQVVEWDYIFESLPHGDRYKLEIGTINYRKSYYQSVTISAK